MENSPSTNAPTASAPTSADSAAPVPVAPPLKPGMSPRRWAMLILAVFIFGLITYHRVTQTPMDQINAVPAHALPKRVVPPFTLTGTDGQTVTNTQLLGRPTLYYFFFSTCPGICPMMNQNAAKLRDALPADSPLRIVGVSVTPEIDTPEVLMRYGTRFKVDPARWLMLTGDRQEIFNLSQQGFYLTAMDAKPEDIPTNGPVLHSDKMVLVNREGEITQYFDGLDEDFPKQVIQALKLLNLDH